MIETPVTPEEERRLVVHAALVAARVFDAEQWWYSRYSRSTNEVTSFVPGAERLAEALMGLIHSARSRATEDENGFASSGRFEVTACADGDISIALELASTCNGLVWHQPPIEAQS